MHEMLSMNNNIPFNIGTVINPGHRVIVDAPVFRKVRLLYPSRINAMAIDPAKVAINCHSCFTPGEVFFAVDIPLEVEMSIRDDNEICIEHSRKSLILHAVRLMTWATGFNSGIDIKVSGKEIPHCGFGSSGRLLAAIAAAINELQGRPIGNNELQVFLAQNHGEEISGNPKQLMPVQCIGGGASAGLHYGGAQVITGNSVTIGTYHVPASYRVVIGWPAVPYFKDSKEALDKELDNISKFFEIGQKYGDKIAYRILHELLPSFVSGDFAAAGDIIEWYRYDLGSNAACSFSHPDMLEWANILRSNKKKLNISICGISSVGPAVYAVTDSESVNACERLFDKLNLQHISVDFWNETYKIIELQ
jgi:predicted sugar kinase